MKILLLINWKIKYCDHIPEDLQPSDYDCPQEVYWFFKYFKDKPEVDVVDISAPKFIEKIENKVRFHFFQTFKILFKLNKYDLIFVCGSNSAMLLCALKRVFHIKTPPILDVDISSFHQAYTSGLIHRLSQFSSRAFDYMVYHTSSQYDYYMEYFPWLKDKCKFVPFGVDYNYWKLKTYEDIPEKDQYIVCVGYRKRDWNTLLKAFDKIDIPEKLYLIGNPDIKCDNPKVKVLPFIPVAADGFGSSGISSRCFSYT
nr:glycosyltransferase [Lactococcus lactis]